MGKENNKKEQLQSGHSFITDEELDMLAKNFLAKLLAVDNNCPEYISAVTELYRAIYRL